MTTTNEHGTAVFCGDCGQTGSVGQVTASLVCRSCGSGNLGLVGVDPRPSVAARTQQGGLTAEARAKLAFGDEHVTRYVDWARQRKYDPDSVETLKRYEREPGIGRAHTNHIADQLYIGGGESDWRKNASQRVAYPHGPGTGWVGPDPRRLDGWSEYVGPTPPTAPRTPPVADTQVCPVCHGSKYDLIDKGPCRECGGTGYIVHPTQNGPVSNYDATQPVSPPGGAALRATSGLTPEAQAKLGVKVTPGSVEDVIRSSDPSYARPTPPRAPFDPMNESSYYPKADTRSPHLKGWEPGKVPSGPYQMDQASCPNCGHAPTELRKDKNEDAWWSCPSCGSLANIDRRPEINPYNPPQGFTPDRSMKTGGFLARNRKTGRLMRVLALVHEANELDETEAVELARKTVMKYGEGR